VLRAQAVKQINKKIMINKVSTRKHRRSCFSSAAAACRYSIRTESPQPELIKELDSYFSNVQHNPGLKTERWWYARGPNQSTTGLAALHWVCWVLKCNSYVQTFYKNPNTTSYKRSFSPVKVGVVSYLFGHVTPVQKIKAICCRWQFKWFHSLGLKLSSPPKSLTTYVSNLLVNCCCTAVFVSCCTHTPTYPVAGQHSISPKSATLKLNITSFLGLLWRVIVWAVTTSSHQHYR